MVIVRFGGNITVQSNGVGPGLGEQLGGAAGAKEKNKEQGKKGTGQGVGFGCSQKYGALRSVFCLVRALQRLKAGKP